MALIKARNCGELTIPSAFRGALYMEPGCRLMCVQVAPRRFAVEVIPRRVPEDFPTFDVSMGEIRDAMGQEIAQQALRDIEPDKRT